MLKSVSPNAHICAMCTHWNGYVGGKYVKPKEGMRLTWQYDPNERQICFKTHMERAAWTSCSEWDKKY